MFWKISKNILLLIPYAFVFFFILIFFLPFLFLTPPPVFLIFNGGVSATFPPLPCVISGVLTNNEKRCTIVPGFVSLCERKDNVLLLVVV